MFPVGDGHATPLWFERCRPALCVAVEVQGVVQILSHVGIVIVNGPQGRICAQTPKASVQSYEGFLQCSHKLTVPGDKFDGFVNSTSIFLCCWVLYEMVHTKSATSMYCTAAATAADGTVVLGVMTSLMLIKAYKI